MVYWCVPRFNRTKMVDKMLQNNIYADLLKLWIVVSILLLTVKCSIDSDRTDKVEIVEDVQIETVIHGAAERGEDNGKIKDNKDDGKILASDSETEENPQPVMEGSEKMRDPIDDESNTRLEKTVNDGILEETPQNTLEDGFETIIQDDSNMVDSDSSDSEVHFSIEETNSTLLSWFRYFLDPFLEEFKDGIYLQTNHSNATDNASIVSNKTDVLKVINETVPFLNLTDSEMNSTDSSKKTKFQCTGKNVTDNTNATVRIVTSSRLLQLLNFDKNETENVTDCLVVMFYAPWCHFCAKTAPHYNALSRAFPQLDFVAVDTAQFSNLLARFGTVSVPNILVFHQSRAAVKFNQTERTFENFVTFVKNTTGLEPNSTVNVTEADYAGPIPSVPTQDPDIFLWIAWMFVILYSSFMFIKSSKGQQWITRIRILWQEHQHID